MRAREHIPIILIVFANIALAIAYGVANPIFESPDELRHFDFVRHLATGKGLPIQSEAAGFTEYHQPPLYYLIGAAATFWIDTDDVVHFQRRNPFWGEDIGLVGRDNKNQFIHTDRESCPYRGTVLAVHLLRLVSTAFGAATVILTYLIASRAFPRRRAIAIGSAGFVAFNPQFIFISSAVSNDSLVTALSTAVLYALVRWPAGRAGTFSYGLALGLLLAGAILAKLTAVLLIPVLLLAAAMVAVEKGAAGRALRVNGVSMAVVLVLAGWWFARNLLLYGEWSGMDTMHRIWGISRSRPLEASGLVEGFSTVWRSYWANFGSGNVPVDEIFYQSLLGLILIAGLGIAVAGIEFVAPRRAGNEATLPRRLTGRPAYAVAILAWWLVLVLAALVGYSQTSVYGEFGRYLFPAVSSISLLTSLGLLRLVPARRAVHFAGIAAAALFGFSLVALTGYLIPAYSRPSVVEEGEIRYPTNRTSARFADLVELVAYRLKQEAISPGQTLEVDLYWRALRKIDVDYVAFIHLLTVGDNRLVAQKDTYPGGGTFPTSAWRPGELFRDTYRVKMPASIDGPVLLRVDAGLYLLDSMMRLPLISGPPGFGQHAVDLGVVRVPSTWTVASSNRETLFEGGVALMGYEIETGDARAGREGTLALTLWWKALQVVKGDYTVFVHLLNGDGKLVAQHDARPRYGNYPTWAWRTNDVIRDTHLLRLTSDMSAGDYQILVGTYDLQTMARLKLQSEGKGGGDSAVPLGKVTLR